MTLVRTEDHWTWSDERKFPTDFATAQHLVSEVVRRLEEHQWGPRDVFGIQLALDEALANAIKHGNRLDPSKHVHFGCWLSERRVRIEIGDEGPGFQPEEVPDCTADERLEVPSGRGLLLMRSFMCQVNYNAQGNRVVMEKNRPTGE